MNNPMQGGGMPRDGVQHADMPREGASRASNRGDESVGGLLKQLGYEIASLVTKEIALLKAEANESVRGAKAGIAAVSTGGAVMLAGLVILLLAFVYLLSEALAPWLSALIVGAGALLVGFMMVKAGQKKFDADSLKPQHSIDSLKKDKDVVTGRTTP